MRKVNENYLELEKLNRTSKTEKLTRKVKSDLDLAIEAQNKYENAKLKLSILSRKVEHLISLVDIYNEDINFAVNNVKEFMIKYKTK